MNVKTVEELAREKRLAYYKNWRATHRANVKQHNQTYWIRKVQKELQDSIVSVKHSI